MSRPSGSIPQFHYNVQTYNGPTTQERNNNLQPWPQSRPRSVQNVRRPASSLRNHQAPFDSSNFHQSIVPPLNDGTHPDLLGIGMPAPPRDLTRSFSPVPRSSNEEYWNPLNLRASGVYNDQTTLDQRHGSLKPFVRGPGSVGSGAPRSDSGYNSQSVISHDDGRKDRFSMQCDFAQQLGNPMVHPATSGSTPMIRLPSDQRSHISRVSSRSENNGDPLKCPICGVTSKCNSDAKKHKIIHEKVFLCDFRGCKRGGKGFGTSNDLERHKKSVHKIGLLKGSYLCASPACKTKPKIWPRLDNFKQHIERMHKEEDPIELIKKSGANPETPKIVTETPSVDPLDTIHVISGMEKSLSAHSDYGSMVEMHSMPDYPSHQWPTRMDPSDPHLSFYQTSVPVPTSTPRYKQMGVGSHNDTQFPQEQHQGLMQRTASNRSTGTVGNSGSEQRPVPQQQKKAISSAPQTKAQQQASHAQQKQQALKKLSRAMTDALDGSAGEVDLEQLMIRILSGQANEREGTEEYQEDLQGVRSDRVLVSKKEAIKAAQMLSSLIKESPGSAFSQPRKTSQGFDVDSIRCSKCPYAVARPCDLRKHMKRHEKPYGCTYPKCHKRFGAKSDWKRHENSQHFQLEAFRCDHKDSTTAGAECGEHFLRMEHFKKHLNETHKITDEALISDTIRRRCIGKNCQQQFWCGFEQQIIELKERRNAAWDERFDHIAHHFEKEHLSIEDWVCAEENRTKKDLLREMDRYVFDDEDDVRRRAQAKKGVGQGPPPPPPPPPAQQAQGGQMPPMPMPMPTPESMPTPMPVTMQQHQNNASKRKAHEELPRPSKQFRHDLFPDMYRDEPTTGFNGDSRYCCRCRDGPYSIKVTSACMNCDHAYCQSCTNY